MVTIRLNNILFVSTCLCIGALSFAGCGLFRAGVVPPPHMESREPVRVPPVSQPPLHIEELPPDSLLQDGDGTIHPAMTSTWVDSVLAGLSLRRKVAQMIVPFTYSNTDGKKLRELREQVRELGVGGVIISLGDKSNAEALVDTLQSWSSVPLMISADFENGLTMRLTGATEFPSLMALGAADDPDLAYAMGRAVAEEAREVGVHQNYSPVADVNNNPDNPVINVRSFGEDAPRVASLAEAYMRGLQDGRMIATAKHFPGHGDTDVDSHNDLPVIAHSAARLDSVELFPFRRLIDAGVLSVMLGHLAVPAVEPDSTRPATASAALIDTLLRARLGFHGLVVTDALNMKALTRRFRSNGAVAMEAARAGADVLLMPVDAEDAVNAVSKAVEDGLISAESIDRRVRRILVYKEWLGLAHQRVPDRARSGIATDSARAALAHSIARRTVTLVKNDSGALPLPRVLPGRTGCISFLHGKENGDEQRFSSLLAASAPGIHRFTAENTIPPKAARALLDSLRRLDMLIVASFVNVRTGAGSIALSEDQQDLMEQVRSMRIPVVLLSFGSPYTGKTLPWIPSYICSYGDDLPSLETTIDVLFGAVNPSGRLPVSLPGYAPRGHGLSYPLANTLDAAVTSHVFRRVDSLVNLKIRERAFPGAQLLVIHKGTIVHERCFGMVSYDTNDAVTQATMYDLASLSKVVSTTTAAMKLWETGRLDLDAPVARYIPSFARNGKAHVTIRHLLTHSAGLPPFKPYFTFCTDAAQALDTIFASPLDYVPGTRTVYSDLGMITLAKVIERITGIPLDIYARELIFAPLGMSATMYTPPDSLVDRCAPTEYDAAWRKRLLRGTVHDETAALLGGVAGHAGLFSTARDLGRFALMLIGGGELDGSRIVRRTTIDMFTRRQGASSRALGWDTKSSLGSSAGRYFSTRAFGHTGFTGTSLWIDRDAGIAVVFLTNRVHPTRENRVLLGFRPILHDAVREALSRIGE